MPIPYYDFDELNDLDLKIKPAQGSSGFLATF